MSRYLQAALVLGLIGCWSAGASSAADPHAHHQKMLEAQPPSNAGSTELEVPDAVLANQDGVQVNLRGDVIDGRIVVMDFVYTTCTTVCPVLSAVFKQVQTQLGDRLGQEVVMVSISVDPTRDTPARLKSYAAKFSAADGWVWLTGKKQTVTQVLEEFGAYTANFEDHPSMVLVGDPRTNQWSRFLGFPGAEQIVEKVDEISAGRAAHLAAKE